MFISLKMLAFAHVTTLMLPFIPWGTPFKVAGSSLLFHLALRSLVIRLKWISSSVSSLLRSQDRNSNFTVYFFPPILFVPFSPLLQRLKWCFLHFLLIFMEVLLIMSDRLLKSLMDSHGITVSVSWECENLCTQVMWSFSLRFCFSSPNTRSNLSWPQ